MVDEHKPHILHVFPSFEIGGAQSLVCSLINYLSSAYQHTIIAIDNNHSAKYRLSPGSSVSFYPCVKKKLNFFTALLAYSKIIKHIKPDLVMTCNWGTIEWVAANTLLCNIPHLHTEHGFGADEAEKQKFRRVIFRQFFLSRCKGVIVPSKTLQNIAKCSWKLPESKIFHIANGVKKHTNLNRDRVDCNYSNTQGSLTIGTIGSLSLVKNQLRLLRVISSLPKSIDVKILIIGDGPEKENLHSFIRLNHLENMVELTGSQHDIDKAIDSFDIFCLSSDSEQMPVVVLEAMAAGCPIVSTDVGDIKQMVCKENRPYIVEKHAENDYLNKLIALINDKNKRISIGKCNQLRCQEKYSLQLMCDRYEHLLNNFLTQ